MRSLILYGDGSYRNKTQGNATIIFDKDCENEKILIYRNGTSKNSQEAELNCIIYGLEYIKEFIFNINEEFLIEVKTDDIAIVEYINEKIFLSWDEKGWVLGGNQIRSNIRIWYKLALLLRYFGVENLTAIKVNSKEDSIHSICHKLAYKMLSLPHMQLRSFYKSNFINFINAKDTISNSSVIKIEEIKLDKSKSKMPWCITKRKNKEDLLCGDKIYWINQIGGNVVNILVSNIALIEEVHLNCKMVRFNGNLAMYSKNMEIKTPIAVRSIGEDKYVLVMGIQRFFAAKILDINLIPAVVVNIEHEEFKNLLKQENFILDNKQAINLLHL